jgi:hypothetical protein
MRGEGSSQRTCATGGMPGGPRDGVAGEAAPPAGRAACLDLRRLPAPEPMERALQAVDALAPGAEMVLLTPLVPVSLLQVLEQRGFEVDTRLSADWSARVTVRAPARG